MLTKGWLLRIKHWLLYILDKKVYTHKSEEEEIRMLIKMINEITNGNGNWDNFKPGDMKG